MPEPQALYYVRESRDPLKPEPQLVVYPVLQHFPDTLAIQTLTGVRRVMADKPYIYGAWLCRTAAGAWEAYADTLRDRIAVGQAAAALLPTVEARARGEEHPTTPQRGEL